MAAPDEAVPVSDAEPAPQILPAPPAESAPQEEREAEPEEAFNFLFSSRGGAPPPGKARGKAVTPPPKAATSDSGTPDMPSPPPDGIPESDQFHGQRPKQRKPISEGGKKGGKKKGSTPRKAPKGDGAPGAADSAEGDSSSYEPAYGPAVSMRAGAANLFMKSSVVDGSSGVPNKVVEEVAAGIEKAKKGAVPAKWSGLENPDADFRKPAGASGGDDKAGKTKKKKGGGLFKRSKTQQAINFEARAALAYYGTIGGGFGTPRLGLGVALGQFNVPAWLAVRPTGELVVSSVFAHEIQMLSYRGGPANVLTHAGSMRIDNPQGIAISPEGTTMWVSNGGADAIVKYSLDPQKGATSAEFVESASPGLKMPQGLVVEQNILFVASSGHNQIVVLDAKSLTRLFEFGKVGPDGNALLARPTDVAIYHNGKLVKPSGFLGTQSLVYVVDCGNSRLCVFNTDGDFVKTIGSFGTDPGRFHEPLGIAIREEKVFVCEGIGARLQVLSPDGVPLLLLPSPTAGRLVGCAWHESRLYVSEVEAHRLHVFRIID